MDRTEYIDMLPEYLDKGEFGIYVNEYPNRDDLFRYRVQMETLRINGIDVEYFPMPAQSNMRHRQKLESLFNNIIVEKIDKDVLFDGCESARDKISTLMNMSEAELIAISNDMSIEFIVRRYAGAIISGSTKELNEIMNQAMGKPLERRVTENRTISAIERLTDSDLKRLVEQTDTIVEFEEV